jgi:hypothetical protein
MEKKEKYQVSSSVNEGILEIVFTGEVTHSTFENMLNETNAIIKANNAKKVIADFRGSENKTEPSQWYYYLRNYHHAILDIQYAVVDRPENEKYKTATMNAGLTSLKWFTDMDTARKWIKGIKENNIKRYHPDYH